MTPFDAYEIRPLLETVDGAEECDATPEDASYWSLYGHRPGEGVTCIGDFKTEQDAFDVLSSILGREVKGSGGFTYIPLKSSGLLRSEEDRLLRLAQRYADDSDGNIEVSDDPDFAVTPEGVWVSGWVLSEVPPDDEDDEDDHVFGVTDIIAFENGELDNEQVIKLFQYLVDSGLAWSLQGSYGRTAQALIESGEVTR